MPVAPCPAHSDLQHACRTATCLRGPGRIARRILALTTLTTLFCSAAAASPQQPPQTPERDWRDEILYFLMIDRFDDGDPGNNDQGQGEYDPADPRRFSGGDLAGVRRRLDYIQGLGATSVWITPPVENQWWSLNARFGGYHGYWARDFRAVDPHFGTLQDYRALADAMHGRGLRLVQDIVVNHTGDWFGYEDGRYDPADPVQGFVLRPQVDGSTAPAAPFDRNDVRDAAQRAAGWYHWTPRIQDFGDARQTLDWQLADLDDLDTEQPQVRRALREAYAHWIREVGVDGFRVDTAFYVPPEFFEDFLFADDPSAPGVMRVAAAAGRPDFHVFGEGWGVDAPGGDVMARRIETYVLGPDGTPRMPGMINFPLYGTLGDVFARGRPPAELGERIAIMMRVHADPWRMPSFVDNHDVGRFLSEGDTAGLRQALLAIMTLPGIPTLYYGTEQGLRTQRPAMFAAGVESDGRDHFDVEAPLYRDIRRMADLRRGERTLSRGTPAVLAAGTAAPGPVAWRMDHDGRHALVVMNTATHTALLDGLDTGLPAGTAWRPAFALDGEAPELPVSAEGRAHLVLPARAGYVWGAETQDTAPGSPGADGPRTSPVIATRPPDPVHGDLQLAGTAAGTRRVQVVVDADLDHAQSVAVGADGRWQAQVVTDGMIDPGLSHRAVVRDAESGAVSAPVHFRVAREWRLLTEAADPAGDDRGPDGRYVYPDDPVWRGQRPGDLLSARVWTSGGALRLQLRLPGLSTAWKPVNGFDHVALTVFVELAGQPGGATVMPQQQATLPDGLRWHRRLRVNGWSNALFAAEGADAGNEGRALPMAARIDTDAAAGTIDLTLPANALGSPLAGARLYVTTWDYDGGYRPLAPEATDNTFGGGPADGAKVMDAMTIVLPAMLPAAPSGRAR